MSELTEEVQLRLVRRAGAEQDRHMNLARIADALEKLVEQGHQDAKPKHDHVCPKLTWRELLRSWVKQLLA